MSRIIIDSGGTSSDWAILDDSGHVDTFSTKGMNPVSADIESIVRHVISAQDIGLIDHIYLYGAGCSTPELKDKARHGLSQIVAPSNISIESDLLGAAIALCGKEAGVISILGTGSNTAIFDGNTLTKTMISGGYLLGDEGSGYLIGKSLIIKYLRDEFQADEQRLLQSHLKLEDSELINQIYASTRPNHLIASYASLLQLLSEESHQRILYPIFDDFIEKRLLPFGKGLDLGLYFCGSIAFHYQKELTSCLNSVNLQLLKIIPKPIEALIQFHNEYL